MNKFKIGLVGVNSPAYYAKEYNIYENSIDGLKNLGKKYGFELLHYPELIEIGSEAEEVKEFFLKNEVDFLLIQNSSFSTGDVIKVLAPSKIPLGIWAVTEPEQENDVKLHGLVSLNMYTSIIKRCFKDEDIKYKWFYGNVDSKLFIERFEPTILALKAISKLRNAKICWVGTVAPSFDNLEPDLVALQDRYGIDIELLSTDKLKLEVDSLTETEIEEAKKSYCKGVQNIYISDDMFTRGLLVYAALSKIAKRDGYDGMALSCWPDFQDIFGIVPCVPFTEMYDIDNIPISCEGDLQAVITMIALNAMTENKAIVMDFANVDIKNDKLLLWHCGIGTKTMAEDLDEVSIINQPMMNRKLGDEHRMGLSYDYYFKETKVTIARVSDNGESLFYFGGNIVDNRNKGFAGTRGWIGNIDFEEGPISVLDLMNTILEEGIEHHLIIVEGECMDSLSEFAYWTDSYVTKASKYKNYL